MNDLINKFQLYHMMDPLLAMQKFEKSLFNDNGNQFLIVGDNAFLYDQSIIEWNISGECLNCLTSSEMVNGKCCMCNQFTKLKLTNNTGIPRGKKCMSKFYCYNIYKYSKEKTNDKLIIVQQLNARNYINTLQLQYNLGNRPKLLLHMKWLSNYDAILFLFRSNFLPELITYIMQYLIPL